MSAEITTDEAIACLGRYPAIGSVESAARVTGPFHNAVFRVLTDRGEFYLKVLTTHAAESTEERYEFLDWAMEQFRKIGVSAPAAIRNAEGKRLTLCGTYPAVLSAAIPGDEFHEEILAQHESAGRVLGRFHCTAARSTPRGSTWLKPLGGYLVQDESLLDQLPGIPEARAVRQWFGELLARSRHIAEELDACGCGGLPRSGVHSEVTRKHLRVDGDQVCGVLDFEYACWGARAMDVGRSLTGLLGIGPDAQGDAAQRTRAFLKGYHSAGWSLQPEELAAVPVLVKTWEFECITFFIHQMIQTRASLLRFDLASRVEEWLPRVDWWEKHGDMVAERLRHAAEGL